METLFKIETCQGSVSIFIPRHSPAHDVQRAAFLSQASYDAAKTRANMRPEVYILEPEKWRTYSSRENGFVDVASFNTLSFRFEYQWHYDYRPFSYKGTNSAKGIKFEPTLLESDCLKVAIRADSIEAVAYPTLIPCVLNFKENVFGYWDDYTPFSTRSSSSPRASSTMATTVQVENTMEPEWKPPFRPFSVIVDLQVTEIVARLPFAPNVKMKHGGPLVRIPTIWFELDKHYTETRMQLTLSDADLIFDSSNVKFNGLQYRGFAFFSAEGEKRIDLPLEYAWMQQIEVGKLSGAAPLDFLANMVLWVDQLAIILDDAATTYTPPRILDIGDEMKYEKLQLKWLGADVVVTTDRSKAKIKADAVELHLNNLRNKRRAGYIDAKLGSIKFELGVHYNGVWLRGGQIEIPAASASVEHAFDPIDLKEQQAFLRRHDKRTMRLKFLWDVTLERNVSLKSDWGCVWFQRTTSATSTTKSLATPAIVRRGGSLLEPDRQLLEIDRAYDPTHSLSRIRVSVSDARRTTTASLMTEDGLSLAEDMTQHNSNHLPPSRGSIDSFLSRSSLRSSNHLNHDNAEIQAVSSLRLTYQSELTSTPPAQPKVITPGAESRLSQRSRASSNYVRSKSTTSSMTDINTYHSAVSSMGSTNTMDEFFSCDEDEDDDDPRNRSVASDQTLEPTPLTEQSFSESSTLLGCTPTLITTTATTVTSSNRLSERQTSRSSRDDSISSRATGGRRSHTNSVRETSFSEPRHRPRPSNLPLSNICSPEPLTTSDSEQLEPYDEFLVHLNEHLAEAKTSPDSTGGGGVTNAMVVPNLKARLVSFETPVSQEQHKTELNDTTQDSSKVVVSLASRENASAVDVFMTPLSLIAADYAIEEVHQVCNRLHYSTISTILLGKVLKDAKSDQLSDDEADDDGDGTAKESSTLTTKKSLIFKIDNIKIGLLQSSTNHEAVFNQSHTVPRHMPCLTYLIIWFDTVEVTGGLDQHNQFTFSSQLRRLHTQLRANTVPKWEDKLDVANIVHLQESEHRPQRQVMVGFKTKNDWGFIMAEAGIEGASLAASHFDRSKAKAELATDRIWTLAAAPSSLSKQRQWSLLSTASSGVKSWIEHTEEISSRLTRLHELIIEQRCKVVTAPLAHHLAQEQAQDTDQTAVQTDKVDEVLHQLNDVDELPLDVSARALRKSTPLAAALAIVKLLSEESFVAEAFRDGSDKAEYFLPDLVEHETKEPSYSYYHIPRLPTLKKGLLLICAEWQRVGDACENEEDNILRKSRMPTISPLSHNHHTRLQDLELGQQIAVAKTLGGKNSYSLPRGGIQSLIKMKSILDYCAVQIIPVPETFSSLFKKGIDDVKVSIVFSKIQVYIKESRNKMKNQFLLQRINQAALSLDHIKIDAKITIPQSDENQIPAVDVNIEINELAQRLDVTLMRLIAQVKGVADSIIKAKMAHKIGQYEKKLENEPTPHSSDDQSSIITSEQVTDVEHESDQSSNRSHQDAICWRHIYKIIEAEAEDYNPVVAATVPTVVQQHDAMQIERETYTSPISHRSTIKISESLLEPRLNRLNYSDEEMETKLKVTIKGRVRKVTLEANVGGLALRIFLTSLGGRAVIERQDVLGELQLDNSGKVMHQIQSRVSVPTTKLTIGAELKSVIIDFLETKTQNNVLKLDVEPSSFEAKPNRNEQSSALGLQMVIGATKVSLPLTASKIHNVLNRAHDTVLDDLGDFITFRANYSSSDLKTGDYVPPPTATTNQAAGGHHHQHQRRGGEFDQTDHVFANHATPGELSRGGSYGWSGGGGGVPHHNINSIGTPRASTDVSRASIIPLVFEIELKGMNLTTKLLDTIQAEYSMGAIVGQGETVVTDKLLTARFEINHHEIKIDGAFSANNTEKCIQKIELPPITFDLELHDENQLTGNVEIQRFEEELTTDLFNLLIFLQEELRTELNDILNQLQNDERSIFGSNQPVPPPPATPGSTLSGDALTYTFNFTMRGINVTAKTPTGNMVIFDVPVLEARVKNKDTTQVNYTQSAFQYPPSRKVYVSGKIELKLSLLCLTANQEEKRLASFDAILEGHNTNESVDDVLLVELKQPYIFIHSNAIDRAVLVYLNYRTAYQTWKDEIDTQRVKSSTRASHVTTNTNSTSSSSSDNVKPKASNRPESTSTLVVQASQQQQQQQTSKLFLKVTVHDFKIKMPLLGAPSNPHDTSHALLLVIQSIVVSGSIGDITGFKGIFNGFELFFAAENDTAINETKLNTCCVQNGELEIISETDTTVTESFDAKVAGIWNLLIRWNMQGLDVKIDTNAGALFSRLGTTLTTLTEDNPIIDDESEDGRSMARYKELEAEYHMERKTLEDMRTLGASNLIVEGAAARLLEIEKELKQEYMYSRKRRHEKAQKTTSSQSPKSNNQSTTTTQQQQQQQQVAKSAEIALILDASIKINTGTIECYPTAAKEKLNQLNDDNNDNNTSTQQRSGPGPKSAGQSRIKDTSMTVFLLPGLNVALNYRSHGTGCGTQNDLPDRRARLISNVVIDSMPKEMSISPSFLDYLSETLDSLDSDQKGKVSAQVSSSAVANKQAIAVNSTGGAAGVNTGFSVDVIVHALVKPSTIMFSCQPKAKVECTLRVPQMNFVFSSTPPTQYGPSGMKLTCQMSEFALRVNHPFDKNAKGCLHVSLESIAVNFIREKRKEIMVSVISEIGVATVNYDMRRLSEILAFPKAWYNRSIARRLFLGELGATSGNSTNNTNTTNNTAPTHQPQSESSNPRHHHEPKNGDQWRTAVRVSTVLRELRIEMNIGNVLGKTTWINQELIYHGAFDLAHDNNNDIKSVVKLTKSKLESRSGLLGGNIQMEDVEGSCLWREGKASDNFKGLEIGLKELGIRIEYHSSVIILSKLTQPKLKLNDVSNYGTAQLPMKEINVQLFLTWDDFCLFMSRSSTPNFIQGARKVAEFIQGQIKSGSEALSSFFDVQKSKDISSVHDVSADEKYQRHWPPIIQMEKSIKEFNLGGTSNMKGKHLTIVCFDGRDFKAENWAVFSVNTPDIFFSTDVRQEEGDGGKECAIVYQSFNFTIAQSDQLLGRPEKEHVLGAFIVRVNKTPKRRRPGAGAGVQEWNKYAVPLIDQTKPEETKADDIHVIFAIPQIEIQLKTQQGQEMRLPAFPEAQKVVCTFSAEFRQELKVTMVPGQIFFLKRFITEYVRENMSVINTDAMGDESDQGEDQIHASYNDERDYVCRTWQLEPKLRFLYWNSALEAPGIDAILQRLGFTHARVTIPKWFQRGMLDKLDSTHANLAKQIIQLRFKNKN